MRKSNDYSNLRSKKKTDDDEIRTFVTRAREYKGPPANYFFAGAPSPQNLFPNVSTTNLTKSDDSLE